MQTKLSKHNKTGHSIWQNKTKNTKRSQNQNKTTTTKGKNSHTHKTNIKQNKTKQSLQQITYRFDHWGKWSQLIVPVLSETDILQWWNIHSHEVFTSHCLVFQSNCIPFNLCMHIVQENRPKVKINWLCMGRWVWLSREGIRGWHGSEVMMFFLELTWPSPLAYWPPVLRTPQEFPDKHVFLTWEALPCISMETLFNYRSRPCIIAQHFSRRLGLGFFSFIPAHLSLQKDGKSSWGWRHNGECV